MLFRAVIVDPVTKEHKNTGFMLDPWEQEIGLRHDVIPGIGGAQTGVWLQRAWPAFVYNEPTLQEVGKSGNYTLFRRTIDKERERRWLDGERFQVESYTE